MAPCCMIWIASAQVCYVLEKKKKLLTVTASDWYLRPHVYQSSDIRARVLQLVVPGSGITVVVSEQG